VNVPVFAYIVVKLEPEPDDGLPPVAVQANVYGVVPPEPVAVKVTVDDTPPVVGPSTVTARVNGLIVIVADAVAVWALESVIVTETVKVPFDPYVVVKLTPVPEEGVPVAVQENVYGDVPPVGLAVNVAGLPAVPVVGPVMMTAKVRGEMLIEAVPVPVAPLASVTVRDTV
jgi:hypothetical protein